MPGCSPIRGSRPSVVHGRLQSLETTDGPIAAEVVVSASGIWSPRIGRMAGITIPLLPMQHQYAATGPIAGLDEAAPMANLRDPDGLVYFRQDGTTLVLGGYERDPASFEVDRIPAAHDPTVHPFDQAAFRPAARGSPPAGAGPRGSAPRAEGQRAGVIHSRRGVRSRGGARCGRALVRLRLLRPWGLRRRRRRQGDGRLDCAWRPGIRPLADGPPPLRCGHRGTGIRGEKGGGGLPDLLRCRDSGPGDATRPGISG